MSILNSEQYRETINRLIGEGASDEQLADLENLNDTYNALESQSATALGEVVTMERYNQLDNEWRDKYRNRFYGEDDNDPPPADPKKPNEGNADKIKISDLFSYND